MKIAVVYDYIPEWGGGGERMLYEIVKHFAPDVDFYSAFTVRSSFSDAFIGSIKGILPNRTVYTGSIVKGPLKAISFRIQNFLLPANLQSLPLHDYDLVISYTAFLAHSIKPPRGKHILIMNTPARFLWNLDHAESLLKKVTSPFLITDAMRYRSRLHDLSAIENPDKIITISKAVKKRIKSFYNKDASVLYPPSVIDKLLERSYQNPNLNNEFGKDYLIHVGRVESYKKVQLIIDTVADKKIKRNVIIAGDGPYLSTLIKRTQKKLKTRAKKYLCKVFKREYTKVGNIYFTGLTPEKEKFYLLANASAFLALNDEDFGITKVEALAMGTPIIGIKAGANTEIIIAGKTGILFNESTTEALNEAIERHDNTRYDIGIIRNSVIPYTINTFHNKLTKIVGA